MGSADDQSYHERVRKSLWDRLADIWYGETPPPPLVRAYIPPAPFTRANALFKNADEAGKAAALAANPQSQNQGIEFGGRVFKLKDNLYSYTGPFTQNRVNTVDVDAGVTGTGKNPDFRHPTVPVGTENAGDYHTHPMIGPLSDRFSYADVDMVKAPAYLATPAGRILKYDPKSGHISVLKEVQPASNTR